MEFKRFKEIIVNSRKYEGDVKEVLKAFHDRVHWPGDIPKLMKEIGKKLNVLIIEIPMRDSDFGAVYFSTMDSKYLLLNSNQPRNKMYFSFCHDIYHILKGTSKYINEEREVHFNQDYSLDENECKANLFAANLLMPEIEFKKMYELYKDDSNSNLALIVVKLMNYFNSPFTAALIRLFELNIYKNPQDAVELLNFTNEDIEKLFTDLWLDKEILTPTRKDEIRYVYSMLHREGTSLIEEKLISRYDFRKIMGNIERFYNLIRLENNNG